MLSYITLLRATAISAVLMGYIHYATLSAIIRRDFASYYASQPWIAITLLLILAVSVVSPRHMFHTLAIF